jgi:transcriptional regulator with XRE-family HTH domain
VRLCSITPRDGGFELRLYDHAALSEHRRSSAVTWPLVASLILRTFAPEGQRLPLSHRLTVAPLTPIMAPKLSWESFCSAKKFAKIMYAQYQVGSVTQAHSSLVVVDNLSRLSYRCGMKSALARLIADKGYTTVSLGERVGKKGPTISRYQTNERSIPDAMAIKIAEVLEVTPFDVKESFLRTQVAGLPPDTAAARLADVRRDYEHQLLLKARRTVA